MAKPSIALSGYRVDQNKLNKFAYLKSASRRCEDTKRDKSLRKI
ncbi:hypothetical protein GCM10011391_20160 [Pullulanibacillus camelliae]|uniref:Uncharacterized protein n=1 Tax=Pullulanibacillus camelliae TaxID=1707096 RepID=A0A8J2W3B2_9BACL|nr:hypothetical protein GCM10011391_20160 [Pullulanibacillus camelliae]